MRPGKQHGQRRRYDSVAAQQNTPNTVAAGWGGRAEFMHFECKG